MSQNRTEGLAPRTLAIAWVGTFVVLFAANGLTHAGPGSRFFDAELAGIASARRMAGGSPLYAALIDLNLALAMFLLTVRGIRPAHLPRDGAFVGGLLGLVASLTWNLANHIVIVGWPMVVTLVDVSWHVGLGALAGYVMGRLLARAERRTA